MSGPFATAMRERVRLAYATLQSAHRYDDVDELIGAKEEVEDMRLLAHAHGVQISPSGAGQRPAL